VPYIEYFLAQPSLAEMQRQLREALGFTEEDLEHNRAGRIGPNQRRALLKRALFPPLAALACGVAFSVVLRLLWEGFASVRPVHELAAAIFIDLLTLDFARLYRDYMVIGGEDIPPTIRAILMLPVGVSLLQIRRPAIDALTDAVQSVAAIRGTVRTETEERLVGRFKSTREAVQHHYLIIDTHRLSVAPRARDALLSGVEYWIYYSPHSSRVLSADPLPHASEHGEEIRDSE
jgi:hypothetical protein